MTNRKTNRQSLSITVQDIAYHRNGMCGAGFHVVTFRHHVGGEAAPRNMVATVFEQAGHVAVFDRDMLGAGAIEFGGTDDGRNSWRGDNFEGELRKAIARTQVEA